MLISPSETVTSERRSRFLAVVEGTLLTSASAITSMRLVFEDWSLRELTRALVWLIPNRRR